MTPPALAVERRRLHTVPAAIDRDAGAQQQTRRAPLLLSIDGTDRRTPDRYTDRAAHDVI